MNASSQIALFTKSYAGDFEMCRRLCDSVDRRMPGMRHYLVVDRMDRALFAPLAHETRTLLVSEEFVPEVRTIVLGGRRWQLTPYGPPMRGWIFQQFVKLTAVATLPETAVALVDSDAVFARPVDPDQLIRDGRTRFYRAPGAGRLPSHEVWHRVAARMLGLPPTDYFGADYVGGAVVWRPDVVQALIARMRSVRRLPWRMALSWRVRFSEYILYGVFADHVKGPHQDRLFAETRDLCHCSWHYDLEDEAGRRAFIEGIGPDQPAILLQSNLRLPAERREALLREVEARAQGLGAP